MTDTDLQAIRDRANAGRTYWRREKLASAKDVPALLAEVDRLRMLLVRKNEALSIFASARMWMESYRQTRFETSERIYEWDGSPAAGFGDPMAFARGEAAAEEACG